MQTEQTQMYKTTRVIWYIFYVIETILLFRFILKLLAANAGAGFSDLIYTISYPFAAPFLYVFSVPSVGGVVVEWGTLLAMVVYWVVAWGIVKLILMKRPVSEFDAQKNLNEQDEV